MKEARNDVGRVLGRALLGLEVDVWKACELISKRNDTGVEL